ncbi:MAG: hypothetical protein IJ583_10290, partial [Firmicutes bacterium]|nr:hypothetical protein [Bacillota bacterium]
YAVWGVNGGGHIESPATNEIIDGEEVLFKGWHGYKDSKTKLQYSINNGEWVNITDFYSRTDISTKYPQYTNDGKEGFSLSLPVSKFNNGSNTVKLRYLSDDNYISDIEEVVFDVKANAISTTESTTETTTEKTTTAATESTTEASTQDESAKGNIGIDAPISAGVGSEIEVKVNVKDAVKMAGGELILQYDDSLLEVVSSKVGETFSRNNISPTVNDKYDSNKIFMTFYNMEDIDINGELITIVFKSKGEGKAKFNITKADFSDYDTNSKKMNVLGAEMTIVSFVPGDVNNDGDVNYKDSILIVRHNAKTYTLTEEQLKAGDVNNDGETNYKDAILISRKAAGTYNF